MFCLKCGVSTGSDSEFCQSHADDPVTEQSVKDQQESIHRVPPFRRCPACNEQVRGDATTCPSCSSTLVPVADPKSIQ